MTPTTKQLKSPEKPISKGELKGRNEKGQFVKGEYGGGPGRSLGSRNFSTDFDEVLEEIARINNITKSEARKILLKRAYSEAKDGNFQFYKDIVDRDYGKAPDSVDITTSGEKLTIFDEQQIERIARRILDDSAKGKKPSD